ncbi:MAG: hypothetical protein ACO1OQ_08225, partial [Rufibacter sp.]
EELKQKNQGQEMQQLFPEGFVFINALYGLAWCELALANSHKQPLVKKAQVEALFAYEAIDSDIGKGTFSQYLEPSYGIFYTGWKNYLLSKILSLPLTSALPNQSKLEADFKANCQAIATAMRDSKSPYLESYGHNAWPADMFLAVASLANHDQRYPPLYQKDLQTWLQKVKAKVDPKTKMLPHKVDSFTGETIEEPRGGSMSLMLRLLAEIDPTFAKEQYRLFKKNFVSTALGLPAVREYPMGKFGLGDIDSGPVIMGVGFPATIVSIGTFQIFGDEQLSRAQYRTVHAFGTGLQWDGQKKYLFGVLPVADAFIAWSRATHFSLVQNMEEEKPPGNFLFHLLSLGLLLLLWLPFYFRQLKSHVFPVKT